jgi:hypothetical protein
MRKQTFQQRIPFRQQRVAGLVLCVFLMSLATPAYASSWNPTFLVNTESFDTVDAGSGNTDIELRFGDSTNEKLYWDYTNSVFRFTDDLFVSGTLSGSRLRIDGAAEFFSTITASGTIATDGGLMLNQDADSNDATLTFGSDTTNETLKWANSADWFVFSDDVSIQGTMSGRQLYISGTGSSPTLYTDSGKSGVGTTNLKATFEVWAGGANIRILDNVATYGTSAITYISGSDSGGSYGWKLGDLYNTGSGIYLTTNTGSLFFAAGQTGAQMTLTTTGRLGVGTTTPDDLFEVSDGIDDQALIRNDAPALNDEGWATGEADYAELMEKLDPDETILRGDIVGIVDGKVTRDLRNADSIMVISTKPGFIGNNPMEEFEKWILTEEYEERYGPVRDESLFRNDLRQEVLNPEYEATDGSAFVYRDQDPNWVAVTFIGQTPVRIRGIVHAGDYIVPSGLNDGTGIAVPHDDITFTQYLLSVGIAWESSDATGIKKVNAAIGIK